MPSLPITDVTEYMKETRSIILEPDSFMMAFKGAKNPDFICDRFRQYDPVTIMNMPSIPQKLSFSLSKSRPVSIIKAGVKARKGSVSDRGETFIAFI
jgi:hypothetical protein